MSDNTTRLEDVIVPEVFNSYMAKDTMQQMAFYNAGVLRADGDLSGKLAGGGRTFNVPFWKDLDDTESNTASDDPDSYAEPRTIDASKDVALRQVRTQGWSTANLVSELAGSDPMQQISRRAGSYWGRQFDDIAIATARGVFASNAAYNGGDMIYDVSNDNANPITPDELINTENIMAAAQTMGDAKRTLNLIIMHSVVHTRLTQNDLIDFRPDSSSNGWLEYFQGYRIHVSDRVPVIVGDNKVRYHNYIFGPDAFGWAEHDVAKPVEVKSDAAAADGMGTETLWTRRQFALHPYGIKWTDDTVSGIFPTNNELRLAQNWRRVYPERKMIPMALLITNG
jgi:hypothetical protein